MRLKSLGIWSALALSVVSAACQKSSPTRPSDSAVSGSTASVKDAVTGVTLTEPTLITPTVNQQFKYTEQPLTLTVKNAVQTGTLALTYTFEVAGDAAFAAIVYSKQGVAEGSGQTSLKIDTLPSTGAKSYFWRARASTPNTPGPNAVGRGFAVGPPIVIQAPTLAAPAQGGTLGSNGTLTANIAAKTGPAGAIVYRFEVSDSSAFGSLAFVSTVSEGSGQTATSMTAKLNSGGTYFWRVQASDPANQVTSPYSPVSSFKFIPFEMSQATIVSSPFDLATWAETAKITSVEFTDNYFLVDFDKRTSPDRWPDTPFGTGDLQYTLGLCGNINNHWFCSAVVQFWYGRDLNSSGPPRDIGLEWFYDPARWGPMTGYQPVDGETVGVFVCAGNCRNNTAGDNSYVKERSNVAFVQWNVNGQLGIAARTLRRR